MNLSPVLLLIVLPGEHMAAACTAVAMNTGRENTPTVVRDALSDAAGEQVEESISLFNETIWTTTNPSILNEAHILILLSTCGAGISATVHHDGTVQLFTAEAGTNTYTWSREDPRSAPQSDEDALRALREAWGTR